MRSVPLIIESLEEGDRPSSRRTYEVPATGGRDLDRARIEEFVSRVHPGATLEAFSDGIATFRLGASLLSARFLSVEPTLSRTARAQVALFAS